MDLSVREILPIITLRQNGYGALQGHYFGMCSKTLPGEKRAFKPFAATGELQPSESKTATFLRKMTKKWPFGAPQVAISPFGNGKNRFFRQKRTKSGSSKKKEPGRGSNPNPKRQARSLNPIITLCQNGYGALEGRYLGILPQSRDLRSAH